MDNAPVNEAAASIPAAEEQRVRRPGAFVPETTVGPESFTSERVSPETQTWLLTVVATDWRHINAHQASAGIRFDADENGAPLARGVLKPGRHFDELEDELITIND